MARAQEEKQERRKRDNSKTFHHLEFGVGLKGLGAETVYPEQHMRHSHIYCVFCSKTYSTSVVESHKPLMSRNLNSFTV